MPPTTGNRPPLYLGKSRSNGQPVRFTGEGSLLTVGPPGTGKSRGVVVWNLLHYPGSLLVTDPKGELAGWSARYRAEKLGQSVAVLDPYGLTDLTPSGYNPLTGLLRAVKRGHGFRGEAERLGHALLPDLPDAKDPYWRNGGRSLIVAACLNLAALHPQACTLPQVHRLLWQPESGLLGMAADMAASPALGGALAEYGANLKDAAARLERQFANFQQEARQALSIYAPDEPIGRACVGDLDFSDLLTGSMTVYLTLPPHLVASHGRWMGLVTSQAVAAAMETEGEWGWKNRPNQSCRWRGRSIWRGASKSCCAGVFPCWSLISRSGTGRMAEGKPHVPAEFAGKADSPEAAAEIVADVVGLGTGPLRAEHHRELAEAEGRGEDAAFYAEMRDILLRWADES